MNNDLTVDEIPETSSGHLPGPPSMRRQVKSQMARSGFRSDARHESEIVRTVNSFGDTYDLPGRSQGESRLVRVTFKQSKDISIAVQQLAAHAIHVTAIYTDTNEETPGMWIQVEYETIGGNVRTVFDRIERFTRDVAGGSPWDEVAQYTGLADRDIAALQRYLSLHIRSAVTARAVTIGNGTSKIGWTADFKGYARPGYTRLGLRGLYASDAVYPWSGSGDLQEQRRVLVNLLRDSPRALLACGFATAGLLMRPLGITENYILALVGPDSSSMGKTSLMLVIKSFFGVPDQLKTFDSTAKSLRASALYGNDSTVLIDEIGASGKNDPRERDAFVYGLAAGVPRDRLVKENGEFRPSGEATAARYTALVTGEESLIDKATARKGIKIRYSELPVTSDRRLWQFTDAQRMEEAMAALQQNYGHIYPALVDTLIDQPEYRDDIQTYFRHELITVRERCGNEKQARKARIVALSRAGLMGLSIVLDPKNEHPKMWDGALHAAEEMLDDYIDTETQNEVASGIAALPLALAQHLAIMTKECAKMPSRTMVGSMFPNEIRYRNNNFGDVKSIGNEPPGEKITGTLITLNAKLASQIVREKLGIDLDALVREGVRHGLVKLNVGNKGQGWRSTSMTKFIVAEDGSTSRSRGIEIIIPSAWEPVEAETKPEIVSGNALDDAGYDVDFDAVEQSNDDYDNDEPPF